MFKTCENSSGPAIGQKSDPFLGPAVEITQISRKVPPHPVPECATLEIDRPGDEILPTGAAETLNGPWHMRSAGHQQDLSLRDSLHKRKRIMRVFRGVTRGTFDMKSVGSDPCAQKNRFSNTGFADLRGNKRTAAAREHKVRLF